MAAAQDDSPAAPSPGATPAFRATPAFWAGLVGRRVVVRYRIADGGLTDVLGDLESVDHVDGGTLVVLARTGPVRVPVAAVVAGKGVPPRPVRAAPPHLALSIDGLEAVTALHWQAAQTQALGGWLLRAAGGFTNRANSMLPRGDPGLPAAEALAAVERWYAGRGLPARASIATAAPGGSAPADPGPDGAGLDGAGLDGAGSDGAGPRVRAGAALRAAGWSVVPDGSALVLTAATAALIVARQGLPAGLTLDLADAPDTGWLTAYRYRGRPLPAQASALLTSAPAQVFASVRDGGATAAIARGSLAAGWGGVTAVEVDPAYRRRGLARLLLAELAGWFHAAGARSTSLQVAESNTVAQRLYLSAGFTVHHRYDYLQAPG